MSITRVWLGNRPWLFALAGALLVWVPAIAQQPQSPQAEWQADIDLNESNYAVWRDHILPLDSELAWEQIPWITTFKDGVLAADAAGKPLLFWTMNGHPLGCT